MSHGKPNQQIFKLSSRPYVTIDEASIVFKT